MSLDGEAFRRQTVQVSRAFMHVEYALAFVALEVVMMTMVRGFVPRPFAGQYHRLDFASLHHQLEIAIDGRCA